MKKYENCVLNGDSEVFLSEIIGAQPIEYAQNRSICEYGSKEVLENS